MAATDTTIRSDYTAFFKEWYLPVIEQQRNVQCVFMDDQVMRFDREHIAGDYALIPVEFDSRVGVGARAENAAMPIPDAGIYDTAKISLAYLFNTFQLSLQLLRTSEGDRAAFNPAMVTQVSTSMRAWLQDLNRQFLGNQTGWLALMDESSTDGDSDAKDIDCAWGITNTDLGANGNGDLFIAPNMRINIYNTTTSKRTDGGAEDDGVIRITAFTRGSGSTEATITMDDGGTAADGDFICVNGNRATSADTCYEINGIQLLVDDGTLATTVEDISSDTRPDWKAHVYYGSSAGTVEALTRARMNQPYKDILKRGGGKVDMLFCGVDTEETYLELADSMGMTVNPIKLDVAGNWEGPGFRGAPVISDPIYPEGRMEYIDFDALSVYECGKADWIEGDMGILQKVSGYANWVAEYVWLVQFGTGNRSKLGSLRDIELVV